MLLGFLLKNFFRSFNIIIECNWYGWIDILKIYLATEIVYVIMIMWLTSSKWIALLQTQDLRVDQEKEPYIRLI